MPIGLVKRLLCLCALLGVAIAHAQTARFTGQVTDPQNAAIPNAEVQVVNQETLVKVKTKTDSSGTYTVPYLPAGSYQIIVRASGFSQSISNTLALQAGVALIYNIQLAVGGAESTVTVEGGARSSAVEVDTENAEVSGTLTEKEVRGLQLNGRNYTQLIALTPGVSNQTQQDEARVGLAGSVSYSVNGGRTEYNSFIVDGSETLNVGISKDHTSLIVTPSIDAIQEVKVLTSNYGAMYASTGDGVTLVTTKSGSDQYHGSFYEFLRNEDFNAKGYFDVTNGPPLYRRNDFGGTIGGPLSIPHLYDAKGKMHFFFSEEARVEQDPYAYRRAVPSLAERNGDFSDVCPYAGPGQTTVFSAAAYPDCPSGQGQNALHVTVPGNFVSNGAAPVGRALLSTGVIPYPNAVSGCNSSIGSCYDAEVTLPTYWREELFRIDQTIGDRTHAGFRYIHDESSNTTPVPQYAYVENSFPTIQNRVYDPGLSMAGQLISTVSPTVVNEFDAGYTNSTITFNDVPGPAVSLTRPQALSGPNGLYSIFDNGLGGKLPGIRIAGNNAAYGGYGFGADPGYMPWEHTNPVYSFSDNISKTLGQHALRFGAQWLIFQRNQVNGPIGAATGDVQGLLTFSNQGSEWSSGNAFADLVAWGGPYGLLGGPAAYQQDSGQGKYYQRYQILEPYLQDDWKITPRLTVNAGLRVSLFGTYHEKNHNAYNWVASQYSAVKSEAVVVDSSQGYLIDVSTTKALPIYETDGSVNPTILNGIVQCGVNGVPSGCMTGHLWNPAPRVGIAWNPDGIGKTAIRAGYGIFFEHGAANEANSGSLEGGASKVLSMEQLNPGVPSSVGDCIHPCSPVAFPLNVTSIPTRAVWPYVQQWSFSVERELAGNTLGTLGYVGSKGSHLTLIRQLNQLLPASDTINPFGAHEPLLTRTCQSDADTGGGFGDYGRIFTLPGGGVVAPQDPAYVNLETACYGFGAGGKITPSALRTYAPGMGQIYSLENTANSSYHSVQATVRHISGPMMLGFAYTYSHSIDDASDRSDTTFVNSYNVKSNRASSNFDQRQLLHISYVYDLSLRRVWQRLLANLNSDPDSESHAFNRPASSFANSTFAKLLLDHWQLSGLTLFETGIPFTVLNGGSANGVGVEDNAGVYNGVGIGSYPDLVGNPHGSHAKVAGTATNFGPLLLNPGAFAAPRGLTFGSAGRNPLNNPKRWNFDTALDKRFSLGESRNLEFRAEAFNVFNHTQFRIYDPVLGNQPNNTVSCYGAEGSSDQFSAGDAGNGGSDKGCLAGNSFLHPVDAHRPRTIQFGLRLAF